MFIPSILHSPPQTPAKLCALNLFFGRDNELQICHGNILLMDNKPVADLGGCGGAVAPPLASFGKNSESTNFENNEDSRQHDYYYYQFLPCSWLP